jgi:hypothetical protein
VKSYALLKLGAQEQETKVAPSTKNAQPSSVSEIFQCVPRGLFWMGLAVKVRIATEGFLLHYRGSMLCIVQFDSFGIE